VWTYNLGAQTTLTTSADYSRAVANPPLTGSSQQQSVRTLLSTSLSEKTSVHFGARYQKLRSDITDPFHEVAAYAGITYTFR
jgi:hypothetical protein